MENVGAVRPLILPRRAGLAALPDSEKLRIPEDSFHMDLQRKSERGEEQRTARRR